MEEQLILVDDLGRATGVSEKLAAHRRGLRHRAFSVFIFNAAGQLLLQKRATSKYHSGGLWSNTCCGHPRPGEDTAVAARRRLREEMGIDCDLEETFHFSYDATMSNGLIECEFDHVFVGTCDDPPRPDPAEASEWRWSDCSAIQADLTRRPDDYTVWLRVCFNRVFDLTGRNAPRDPHRASVHT